jgi:hypothetical protein
MIGALLYSTHNSGSHEWEKHKHSKRNIFVFASPKTKIFFCIPAYVIFYIALVSKHYESVHWFLMKILRIYCIKILLDWSIRTYTISIRFCLSIYIRTPQNFKRVIAPRTFEIYYIPAPLMSSPLLLDIIN